MDWLLQASEVICRVFVQSVGQYSVHVRFLCGIRRMLVRPMKSVVSDCGRRRRAEVPDDEDRQGAGVEDVLDAREARPQLRVVLDLEPPVHNLNKHGERVSGQNTLTYTEEI